jgi:hypothetical protein
MKVFVKGDRLESVTKIGLLIILNLIIHQDEYAMNLAKLILKIASIMTGLILAVCSIYFGTEGIVLLFRGNALGKYSPWLFALLNFLFIIFGISLFLGCLQLLRKEQNKKG